MLFCHLSHPTSHRPPNFFKCFSNVPFLLNLTSVCFFFFFSLKMECEKLASEKTEMQRHYVMYYEMSYGLNLEMHKQTEIAKRLNVICAQLLPYLSQEHQQQVIQTIERAKQVTMGELNAAIGVRGLPILPPPHHFQPQHLTHHTSPFPLALHPSGLQIPGMSSIGAGSGLLALSNALAAHPPFALKEDKNHQDLLEHHRGEGHPSSPSPNVLARPPTS
uniref:Groucho/TLE N-terminal Q-rich domain-containing protein n=1 Tax=Callorhinchus milii TaxID=7868 RepID=A0A4W3HZ08_CALMI